MTVEDKLNTLKIQINICCPHLVLSTRVTTSQPSLPSPGVGVASLLCLLYHPSQTLSLGQSLLGVGLLSSFSIDL